MKNKKKLLIIAEISICAAIGFVLDFIQSQLSKTIFPYGGSIGFAMVPVIVIAYRRGLIPGVLTGLILSLIQMLGGVYVISSDSIVDSLNSIGITNSYIHQFFLVCGPFIQVLLDYVLGYTLVGFAGVFFKQFISSKTIGKKIFFVVVGTIFGGMLKYISHTLSGVFFWPGEIFGISGVAYSFVYNGLYCIPCIIICVILMIILVKYYQKLFNVEEN